MSIYLKNYILCNIKPNKDSYYTYYKYIGIIKDTPIENYFPNACIDIINYKNTISGGYIIKLYDSYTKKHTKIIGFTLIKFKYNIIKITIYPINYFQLSLLVEEIINMIKNSIPNIEKLKINIIVKKIDINLPYFKKNIKKDMITYILNNQQGVNTWITIYY